MSQDPVVRVTRRFRASPERVFDAFLDPAMAGRFMFRTPAGELVRCEVDGRVGGRFTIVERRGDEDAEHLGEFVRIERPRKLVFMFGNEGWDGEFSQVDIDIAPAGDGCELTLTHRMAPKWADWVGRVEEGWTLILGNLGKALG
ncbi:SRPBCC domain-containing protein [Phenylobacterium terrae]|uniref:SRPBCC domain-containing protein n=1 Tax=Phenylobacterium terrae TaxID=2665495 RepID=A0ABW4N588_9CAUL